MSIPRRATCHSPSSTAVRAAATLVLAVATLALSSGSRPSNLAVVTWIASILAGFDACVRLDRPRNPAAHADAPLSRRERAVVALLLAASLALSLHDLTHWRWSGTPDEAHFFNAAKQIATGELQPFLFSERGVFGMHPILSSQVQGLFMWVLGPTAFAWRLSSAVAVALAVPCLYRLARHLWGVAVATTATLLFATTPLVVGFAHLGYNNTQVYPIVLGALALVAGSQRLDRIYLAGFIAGLGFYTFYPARLAPLLALLLGFCLGTLALRGDGRRRAAAFLAGCALTVAPAAMLLPESLGRVAALTSFGGDYTTIASHWVQAIIYPVYFARPHHFQWTPIVDPVSGPLSLVGLALCFAGWRHRGHRFLAIAYLISALLVGATSHHERPPLTRLLFLSPFVALLSAIALQRATDALARLTRRPQLASTAGAILVAIAALWGVVALQYNVRYRYHGCGDGTTTEAIRIAQQLPGDTAIIYLQRAGSSMLMVDSVFDQYGMAERLIYKQGFDAGSRQILEEAEPPLVVMLDLEEMEQRDAVERLLVRRFGAVPWLESDPGEGWSLRYLSVQHPRGNP